MMARLRLGPIRTPPKQMTQMEKVQPRVPITTINHREKQKKYLKRATAIRRMKTVVTRKRAKQKKKTKKQTQKTKMKKK